MLPYVWSKARQLPLRSACGLKRRIFGSVWSTCSGELKGSQILPEANLLLVSGLWEGSRDDYQLNRRAAGSNFVAARFQSPQSSVSGDSGTASAPRIGENMVSSNVTKQIKDLPFFHGAKAELPKFKLDLTTFAKEHGLFRVFTKDVELSVADEEKPVEEIHAMGFAEDEIRKTF